MSFLCQDCFEWTDATLEHRCKLCGESMLCRECFKVHIEREHKTKQMEGEE